MRMVAHYADEWNVWADNEAMASKIGDRGLLRPALVGTAAQLQDQMAAFVDAGVNEVIISDFNLGDSVERNEVFDRFLAEVAAPLRD